MNYGSSCDGGLLSERRTVATAPTLPPPEPTDEQIVEALRARSFVHYWERSPNAPNWRGYSDWRSSIPTYLIRVDLARQWALDHIAHNPAPMPSQSPAVEPTEAQIREALAATRQAKHWIRAVGWWAGFTSVGDQYPIEFFYPHSARQIALEYLARRSR